MEPSQKRPRKLADFLKERPILRICCENLTFPYFKLFQLGGILEYAQEKMTLRSVKTCTMWYFHVFHDFPERNWQFSSKLTQFHAQATAFLNVLAWNHWMFFLFFLSSVRFEQELNSDKAVSTGVSKFSCLHHNWWILLPKKWLALILLMVQKSQTTTWDVKSLINNRIDYLQYQLVTAGFLNHQQ